MKDLECPYCDHYQEVNHDDGYGYEENVLHQQQCEQCGKYFTYQTHIIFDYTSSKAACLNEGKHSWQLTKTFPKQYSDMECKLCGETRKPSTKEREKYGLV